MTEDIQKVLKKVGMDKPSGINEIPYKEHLRLFIFVLLLAIIYIILYYLDEGGVKSPAVLNPEDFRKGVGKPFSDVLPNLIAPELTCAVKSRIVQNGFDLVHTF